MSQRGSICVDKNTDRIKVFCIQRAEVRNVENLCLVLFVSQDLLPDSVHSFIIDIFKIFFSLLHSLFLFFLSAPSVFLCFCSDWCLCSSAYSILPSFCLSASLYFCLCLCLSVSCSLYAVFVSLSSFCPLLFFFFCMSLTCLYIILFSLLILPSVYVFTLLSYIWPLFFSFFCPPVWFWVLPCLVSIYRFLFFVCSLTRFILSPSSLCRLWRLCHLSVFAAWLGFTKFCGT